MMRATLLGLSLLLSLPPQEAHPVKTRALWTWDTWISDEDPEGRSFLAEYKDLVDWMARREFTDLIVWGFVDGRHGGEAAAKELARYARSKGIRLSPGVSTAIGADGSTGGFARGIPDHPFNDEVQARAMKSKTLCYAKAENRDWLRRGTEWLLDTFDVDGVHVDVAVGGNRCECAECRARVAGQGGSTGAANFSDLGLCVPIVTDVIRQKRPEGLVTYAADGPPWWKQKPQANDLLKRIPEAAVAQWTLELELHEAMTSPVKHNLALVHEGGTSIHLRRRIPGARAFNQFRGFNPRLDQIRTFCRNLRKMKLDGFVVGNVGSPKCPDNELAYLAFIDFSRDPDLTLDAFYKNRLSELYGAQAAEDVRKLFVDQPAAQALAYPFWSRYNGSFTGDAKPAVKALADQIALAETAGRRASADGKRRLDAIVEVLREYKIICDTAVLEVSATRSKLAEFYEKAGLPDDIYQYRKWSK